MSRQGMPIEAGVLRWARERARLSHERLARRLAVSPATVQAWERGEARPTWRQTWALANALHIPIGYLFLKQPPQTLSPSVADFRAVNGDKSASFSPELEDTLNDALRKRDWLREWRAAEGFAPLRFVGRYSLDAPPERVAQDIREALQLPQPTASGLKAQEDHLRRLVQHAEDAGVLVLQSGVALGNPHRPLRVEEFRGFALADDYAPVIFINAQDAPAGRVFTLAHELAHLWIGESGVSNPQPTPTEPDGRRRVETFCNQVAAELLMPGDHVRAHVEQQCRQTAADLLGMVEALASYLLVSRAAVLVRLSALGLVGREVFLQAWRALQQREGDKQSAKPERRGGHFAAALRARNGRPLLDAVAQALSSGQLLITEAAQLLNITPELVGRWLLKTRA